MSSAEYKTVPAPRRVKKIKGVKGSEETLAKMIEDIITEQASSGWDYVRTDTFPVEEKPGWFSSRETVMKGVMVFKRGGTVAQPAPTPQPATEPAPHPSPRREPDPTPYELPPAPTMRASARDEDDEYVARPVGGARSD